MLNAIKKKNKEVIEEDINTSTIENNNRYEATKDLLTAVSNMDRDTATRLLEQFDEDGYVIRNYVDFIYFNASTMEISGYAEIKNSETMVSQDAVEKTLILVNKEDGSVAYETPLRQYESINSKGEIGFDGYNGKVNFSKINKGNPLQPGDYELKLKITQFIEDTWIEIDSSIGNMNNQEKDYVVSTNMYSFSAKSNKKFSLTAVLGADSGSFEIKSKLLSDINPLEFDVDEDLVMDLPAVRKAKNALFNRLYKIFKYLPVNKKKVSFVSDSRIDISGNFEYIYKKMVESPRKFQIGFYLKSSIKERKTLFEIVTMAYNLARSRYIILDDYYPLIYPVEIREKSDLVQVWHAVGAFKTFGYSRLGMPGGPKKDSMDHKNYTKVIVSSENIAEKYAEGFGIPLENVYPLGAARTDMFFDKQLQSEIIERLHEEIPYIKNKKVILFAPTFRGNGQQSAHYPFELVDFKKLYEKFYEDDWVFLLKIHPFVKNKPNIPYEYQDFFYDVSDYREINDLLLETDVLITDYSSVCFEYALLEKKMIFFSPDLVEYMSSRNFYYDYFDFIPGPYASNTDELIEYIADETVDINKIRNFVNYYFDDLDGKSTDRFVEYLENDFYEEEEEEEVHYSEDGKLIPNWGSIKKLEKKLEKKLSTEQKENSKLN